MPIRKAGPQTVHSEVKVSKNNLHTSHALISLLDTSEDEHIESAIPTISRTLLDFVTNDNQQEPTIDP